MIFGRIWRKSCSNILFVSWRPACGCTSQNTCGSGKINVLQTCRYCFVCFLNKGDQVEDLVF